MYFLCASSGFAQSVEAGSAQQRLSSRFAIAAGMGVEYVSATDIADYINGLTASVGVTQRVSSFKAGVGFFGAALMPLSEEFVLKGEYVYFIGSYNVATGYGPAEFTVTSNMPSLILQYVLWDETLYNLKAGVGLGYHFTTLTQKFLTLDGTLDGKGVGSVLELEANTAFGDHLFAYLGADVRFEFVGSLTNDMNSSSSTGSRGLAQPTGKSIILGGRLGLSYIF
jgi:hypothetical protein